MARSEVVVRKHDTIVVEVVNEPTYTFGSTDNVCRYQREELLSPRHLVSSRHGVTCSRNGQLVGSVVIGAGGGASGVHERSLVVLPDACLVAVGPFIVCLDVPLLGVRWTRDVDEATCFGIHLAADGSIISHGELEISRLTRAGDLLWRAGGRDIFTGDVSVDTAGVRAEDFNGDSYTFDLETGRAMQAPPSSGS